MLSIMHILRNKRIVLASSSPRRQSLIKNIGLDAIVCPSLFEENLDPKNFPSLDEFVTETALQKVLEVDERLKNESNAADIVIGADTMVVHEGELFGKPKSEENAFEILSRLSGKQHTVMTGVVIKYGSKIKKFCETTNVYFSNMTSEEIRLYIASKEPMDKAGGYGIQGIGGTLIEKVDGDYFNVMGLPLHKLSRALNEIIKE